uniref:Nonstructural protein 5 n=1 Tax=Bombyx mori cytoplasmic polyhedrosis virus TaxID=110829 RepID=O72505_CPVBM|nr:nonstructural protein 5 [Bombyx mori cypovirus 1]
MEAFLLENRKPKITTLASGKTLKPATHRLNLPAYTKLIHELRTKTHAKVTISLSTESQIHMVWVKSGLVFFTPSASHPAYVNFASSSRLTDVPALTKPTFPQSDAKLIESTPLPNDEASHVASFQLVTWKDGALSILNDLSKCAISFINQCEDTFKSGTNLNKEMYNRCITAESRDFCNQMKFVLIGRLCYGQTTSPPPIQLYQYGVTPFISADIICEGAAYRSIDVENYAMNSNHLVSYAPFFVPNDTKPGSRIDLLMVNHLKKFNLIFDTWYKTGGSVMVSSRPERAQNEASANQIMPTLVKHIANDDLDMDDGDVSE